MASVFGFGAALSGFFFLYIFCCDDARRMNFFREVSFCFGCSRIGGFLRLRVECWLFLRSRFVRLFFLYDFYAPCFFFCSFLILCGCFFCCFVVFFGGVWFYVLRCLSCMFFLYSFVVVCVRGRGLRFLLFAIAFFARFFSVSFILFMWFCPIVSLFC